MQHKAILIIITISLVYFANLTIAIEEISKKTFHIGALIPLTGENEKLGKNMLAAMFLATQDLKANNFILVPINSELSAKAIKDHIFENNLDVILGPIFSKDIERIKEYIKVTDKCFISFSNDKNFLNNNCLMLMGFMPEESIKKVSLFMHQQGYLINALLPQNHYGQIINESLNLLNKSGKIKLIDVEFYNEDSLQNKTKYILEQIDNNNNNLKKSLIIPEFDALKKILPILNNNKIKLIGSNQWENEFLYNITSLEGAYFASAPKKFRDKFEAHYFENYKTKVLKISALAYDATAIICAILKEKEIINKDLLTEPAGFYGITGEFKFLNDGSNERILSIFEIKNGKIIEVEP